MAGTARAAATAVLGLVALQAVGTTAGSGRVSGFFNDLSSLVDRLLDPTVPAIPNLAGGEHWGTGSSTSAAPATWTPGTSWAGAAAGLGSLANFPIPAVPTATN